ncbi:MAG TPA: MBL fold metallo-hydrolase [Terriglobales bacterium]|nr:MBL fold metallo-hydrolase [Terriglobales bacterium]
MLKKVVIALVFTALSVCSANTQKPQTKAEKIVTNVAKTIGADGLKSVQYSANGYYYHFLQGYLDPSASNPGPWTKFYAIYNRSIDYQQNISREEMTWSQFSNPPRGGGYQPMYTPGTMTSVTSNTIGWESMQRGSPTGGGQPVLTPQGFVQAAEAGDPTLRSVMTGGQTFKVVSLQLPGPYKIKVEAYIGKDNLIEKIDTWMPSIIVGDILIEHTYSNYRDFDGVKFPMRIVKTYMGTPALELNVTDVKPNAPVSLKPPREGQPVKVKSFKIADGVWFIDGPGASTAAVEFKDYVVLVESSTSEEHALANIAETKKLFPNKPIRYDINSHYHGDHAGGLRTFIADGETIITSQGNRDFYERVVLKAPFVLEPDQLAVHPKPAHFIWVGDKYVLSDGERKMEIYTVEGEGHCKNILITYMPKEKLLFETDMLDNVDPESLKAVRHPNFPPPGIVSPYTWALWENIQRLHLDVQQIVQCHGHGAVSVDILKQRVNGKVESAAIKPPY